MPPVDLITLAQQFDRLIAERLQDGSATPLQQQTLRDFSIWSHDSVAEILRLPEEQRAEKALELQSDMRRALIELNIDPLSF